MRKKTDGTRARKKMPRKKKVSIVTFGCRLNQADEALLYGRLAAAGYEAAAPGEKRDLLIVNTCTVTASASQKSRQALRRLRRENPNAKIAVTGCDPEVNGLFWRNEPACDIVIPGSMKNRIIEFIEGENPSAKIAAGQVFSEHAEAQFPFKTRALLKIQEGCDCFCAYCIVPFARGRPRSRESREIISECRRLLQSGHKEIVLTGVNICRYEDGGKRLPNLVREILGIDGKFRLRLSSTELDPQLDEILHLMKDNPKLCRFLHVPLQHGSDEILEKMRRRHSTADFANFAEKATAAIPGIHLGTDLICGLPGESEDIFEKSLDFVSALPLANIHIFRYSPRQGTDAAKFAGRPRQCDVRRRMKILEKTEKKLSRSFISSQIGKEASFVSEKIEKDACAGGWSDNYIRTSVRSQNRADEPIRIRFLRMRGDSSIEAEAT